MSNTDLIGVKTQISKFWKRNSSAYARVRRSLHPSVQSLSYYPKTTSRNHNPYDPALHTKTGHEPPHDEAIFAMRVCGPLFAAALSRTSAFSGAYAPPPPPGYRVLARMENVIILDKEAGLLTVPGRGKELKDSLLVRVQRDWGEEWRNAHRLDRDTSGCIAFARAEGLKTVSQAFMRKSERVKSADESDLMSDLFSGPDEDVEKSYVAKVHGILADDRGSISEPIGKVGVVDESTGASFNRWALGSDTASPRVALTEFEVLSRNLEEDSTLVSCRPITGRGHQLRLHLSSLGHPIFGDSLHGFEDSCARLHLHAANLSIKVGGGDVISAHSEVPFS